MWPKTEYILNHIYILGICAVLLGAFGVQFIEHEYPCPLCLLQRMCMILAAIGPAYIILHGRHAHHVGISIMAAGFGMAILAAVAGMSVAARQDLLHIIPGEPGYGGAIFGLHLYTWALIVFIVIIIVSGITLVFYSDTDFHKPHKLPWYSYMTLWIFGAVILANAFNAFAIAGWNLFLPDNPVSYLLFEEPPPVTVKPLD